MSLLVLGTVALDTVKTPRGVREDMLGGSAVHFSMSARLFTEVNLAGVIGSDFPAKYVRFLRDKGIVLDSLSKDKDKTFHWEGEYKKDMNKAYTICTELGVLISCQPKLALKDKSIKNVFLANIDPDEQRLILDSMHNAQFVGLDSMNYWIDNKKKQLLKIIERAHLFVANEEEARSLTGEFNLIEAAKGLLRLGSKMVVIKKGDQGAIFCSANFQFGLPAYRVCKVVDPTGAGDTFAGALFGYLVTHKKTSFHIKKALAYGCVCASFNVEDFGLSKTKNLTLSKLQPRLKKLEKITCP